MKQTLKEATYQSNHFLDEENSLSLRSSIPAAVLSYILHRKQGCKLFLTEEILYNISDLIGRSYHLTHVNFCALRKYFFHMGPKPENN